MINIVGCELIESFNTNLESKGSLDNGELFKGTIASMCRIRLECATKSIIRHVYLRKEK